MNAVNTENNLLSLSEYSNEYGVSVSTLRRHIKGNKVRYKRINGKYFLPRQTSPSNTSSSPVPTEDFRGPEENTFSTSKTLLDELKKAYMQSLQGKEDQILQLKQQITDLKTLVMFLEKENARLQN